MNMSFRHPTQSDPHPLPKSGLSKELEKLGRTRGSSATPVPTVVSPTPKRGFQSQLDRMSASASHGGSVRDLSPATTRSSSSSATQGGQAQNRRPSGGANKSGQNQGQGFTVGGNTSPGASVLHFPTPGQGISQGANLPSSSISQLSAHFQRRLTDVQQAIQGAPGISGAIQEKLVNELRKISQGFNDQQRRVQQDYDRARNERVQLQSQLDEAHGQLQVAIQDRDRYISERGELQAQVDQLRIKAKKSVDKLDQIDKKWKRINEDLIKQITAQEEQLKGKRALWLESNPGSSARRDAMTAIRDPFNSPSTNYPSGPKGNKGGYMGTTGTMGSTSSSMSGSMGDSFGKMTLASPLESSQSSFHQSPPTAQPSAGPAQRGVRRRPNLPFGKALPGSDLSTPGPWSLHSNHQIKTEPGDDRHPPGSMALVLHHNDDDLAPEYKEKFSKIYELIEDWCKMYASVPNLVNDQTIARSNDVLWAYMMNCTYPGHRQDSHTHVMTLLQDVRSRYWFVMRMATTYCVKDIMSIEVFQSFSPQVEAVLVECKKKLMERGLANEVRQNIIDNQAKAVQSVVGSSDYNTFRSNQLIYHTKRLRDMLGPMLNTNCARAEAGRDLGAIAVQAWDICVQMHTSFLTFQVYFPETSTKFTASTMEAKDQRDRDPMQLQIAQIRLKLVITPVVTMRDDRGTTIRAKNLHKSTVLTMG